MSLSKPKRNDLTLKEKYEVIKELQKNPGIRTRKLAENFKCAKTQISSILKRKKEMIALYGENASLKICRTQKRSRPSEYSDMNNALYERYQVDCSWNVYPDGRMVKMKAREIAEHIRKSKFKASNSWLDKRKKGNIRQLVVQ